MTSRSLLARFVCTLLAAIAAFAPAIASVADARQRDATFVAVGHVHAPEASHAIHYPDSCVLCGIATHETGAGGPSDPGGYATLQRWTTTGREAFSRDDDGGRWAPPTRAPPAR